MYLDHQISYNGCKYLYRRDILAFFPRHIQMQLTFHGLYRTFSSSYATSLFYWAWVLHCLTKLTKNRTRNLTEHSEKSASISKTIYRGLTDLQVDNAKTQRCNINTEMLKHRNVPDTGTFRWRHKKSKK